MKKDRLKKSYQRNDAGTIEDKMMEQKRENLFQEITKEPVRKRKKKAPSTPVFKPYAQHQEDCSNNPLT